MKSKSSGSSSSSGATKKEDAKAACQATVAGSAAPVVAPATPAMAAWTCQAPPNWDAQRFKHLFLTPRQLTELHSASIVLNSAIASGVVGRDALKTMGLGFIQIASSIPTEEDA